MCELYALMYFPSDRSSSVIPEKLIPKIKRKGEDGVEHHVLPNEGDSVEIQWSKRKRAVGKILRYSVEKQYLENTRVCRDTGEILTLQRQKNDKCSADEQKKQRKENLEDRKKRKANAESVKQKNSRDLLQAIKEVNATKDDDATAVVTAPAASKPETITQEPLQDSLLNEGTSSGFTESNEVPKTAPATKITKNPMLAHDLSTCSIISAIPVTDDTIQCMEKVLDYMRFIRQQQLVAQEINLSLDHQHERQGFQKLQPWQCQMLGKVELIRGSKVWISSVDLDFLTQNSSKNPAEMIRQLLKNLVGEHELSQRCALGQYSKKPKEKQLDSAGDRRPGIDKSVMNAVEKYVLLHKHPKSVLKRSFTRIVNLLCTRLRHKFAQSDITSNSRKCQYKSNETIDDDEDNDDDKDSNDDVPSDEEKRDLPTAKKTSKMQKYKSRETAADNETNKDHPDENLEKKSKKRKYNSKKTATNDEGNIQISGDEEMIHQHTSENKSKKRKCPSQERGIEEGGTDGATIVGGIPDSSACTRNVIRENSQLAKKNLSHSPPKPRSSHDNSQLKQPPGVSQQQHMSETRDGSAQNNHPTMSQASQVHQALVHPIPNDQQPPAYGICNQQQAHQAVDSRIQHNLTYESPQQQQLITVATGVFDQNLQSAVNQVSLMQQPSVSAATLHGQHSIYAPQQQQNQIYRASQQHHMSPATGVFHQNQSFSMNVATQLHQTSPSAVPHNQRFSVYETSGQHQPQSAVGSHDQYHHGASQQQRHKIEAAASVFPQNQQFAINQTPHLHQNSVPAVSHYEQSPVHVTSEQQHPPVAGPHNLYHHRAAQQQQLQQQQQPLQSQPPLQPQEQPPQPQPPLQPHQQQQQPLQSQPPLQPHQQQQQPLQSQPPLQPHQQQQQPLQSQPPLQPQQQLQPQPPLQPHQQQQQPLQSQPPLQPQQQLPESQPPLQPQQQLQPQPPLQPHQQQQQPLQSQPPLQPQQQLPQPQPSLQPQQQQQQQQHISAATGFLAHQQSGTEHASDLLELSRISPTSVDQQDSIHGATGQQTLPTADSQSQEPAANRGAYQSQPPVSAVIPILQPELNKNSEQPQNLPAAASHIDQLPVDGIISHHQEFAVAPQNE